MSNLGKKYQRRGGRAPRLTQALEVAHRAALKRGYRNAADRHYVEATLAELARRREAHDQARQAYAPVESGTVTGGTVTREEV